MKTYTDSFEIIESMVKAGYIRRIGIDWMQTISHCKFIYWYEYKLITEMPSK